MVRGEAEPERYRGHAELARIPRLLERFDATLHAVLSHSLSLGERTASLGERTAGGEVAMAAHHLSHREGGREADDHVFLGRYFDRYALGEDGRWRFASRRLEVGWTERRRVHLP